MRTLLSFPRVSSLTGFHCKLDYWRMTDQIENRGCRAVYTKLNRTFTENTDHNYVQSLIAHFPYLRILVVHQVNEIRRSLLEPVKVF